MTRDTRTNEQIALDRLSEFLAFRRENLPFDHDVVVDMDGGSRGHFRLLASDIEAAAGRLRTRTPTDPDTVELVSLLDSGCNDDTDLPAVLNDAARKIESLSAALAESEAERATLEATIARVRRLADVSIEDQRVAQEGSPTLLIARPVIDAQDAADLLARAGDRADAVEKGQGS